MNFYINRGCAGEDPRETVNCPFNEPKVKHRKESTVAPTGKVTPNWWKVKLDLKVSGFVYLLYQTLPEKICRLTLAG